MQTSNPVVKKDQRSANTRRQTQFSASRGFPFAAPTFIFAIAFALRYLYNAVFMEHRIAHFGDAYNFLRSGTCLLEAASSSHNVFEYIHKIYYAAAPQAQILQSMTSMKLMDRLLIDGPVYPSYLALVQWLSGINPANPIFDAHSVQICLCNSVVDALACVFIYVCGMLAFNRRAGLIAGLLFATYPAAIINTQHCYSEPFSYFLLSIWTACTLFASLRHTRKPVMQALAWFGIGLFSALMMLAKPAFILLPPMVFTALLPLIYLRNKNRLHSLAWKTLLLNGMTLAIGIALPLIPWACFNKAASGQYSIFVNRVPSFNIFHGNQLKTDGWRAYPYYGTFPGDSKLVIASLLEDAKKEPLPFIGLQFKKIARLWSGVWNEYHYSLFGIPIEVQSLYHQLLLLLGSLSLLSLIFAGRNQVFSRSFSSAIVLGVIVLFHFVYIPFEAISRYAITAIPAICILIAAMFSKIAHQKLPTSKLLGVLFFSTISFVIVAASGITANSIASIFPQLPLWTCPVLATLVDLTCLLVSFIAACNFLSAVISNKNARRFALASEAILFSLVGIVAAFYTIQSHDWKEWNCLLSKDFGVVQKIRLPADFSAPRASTAFILMDLDSQTLAPPVTVHLNGRELTETPVPLAQFQPNNSDILQCLAIQAEGMSRDVRGFRHWWVVPFPSELLKAGSENQIRVDSALATVKLFGDFAETKPGTGVDGFSYLPSLRSFSYTKGFTTFDHRDPRVMEKMEVLGSTAPVSGDLSQSFGTQYGNYRIRILLPVNEPTQGDAARNADSGVQTSNQTDLPEPVTLLSEDETQHVNGNNPASFVPRISSINLPTGLPDGTRFQFSCKTRSIKGTHAYFVGLTFTGTDERGKQNAWNSKWQPIGISASREFKITSFSDIIPAEVLAWKHLQVHPMFSPFQPDYLFLKRREALKSTIDVSSAHLSFLPPLNLPTLEARSWRIY
jgi:4-amino-4-deoxy-L-arabinose transferase-like glycosyltransferase